MLPTHATVQAQPRPSLKNFSEAARPAIQRLIDEGAVYLPVGMSWTSEYSRARYGLAVSLHSARFWLLGLADVLEGRPSTPPDSLMPLNSPFTLGALRASPALRRRLSALAPAYVGAIEETRKVLGDLGVDVDDMKRSTCNSLARIGRVQPLPPGSSEKQFSDVPPNHWAAGAVLDLRRAGILIGYAGGRFGG